MTVLSKMRASILYFTRLYIPLSPNRQLKISYIFYCYTSEVENSPTFITRLSARGRSPRKVLGGEVTEATDGESH